MDLIELKSAAYKILAGAVIGAALGAGLMHQIDIGTIATLRGDIASLNKEHSEQVAVASEAALERIVRAQDRADVLAQELLASQDQLQRITQEKQHALRFTTTGRACLNAATVRVLNQDSATSSSQTASMPETSAEPAAKDGAAATDSDVAQWINHAQQQYRLCSTRLDALIEWHIQSDVLKQPTPSSASKHD